MIITRLPARRRRRLVAAFAGAATVAAIAYLTVYLSDAPQRLAQTPVAAAGRVVAPSHSSDRVPSLQRLLDDGTIRSYQELGSHATATGDTIRVFRAINGRDGTPCLGLLGSSGFGGIACYVDLDLTIPLQVVHVTHLGRRMVGGLVSASVQEVVVTDVGGKDFPLPIRNGTVFYDGQQGGSLLAYNDAGELIGAYVLDRPAETS